MENKPAIISHPGTVQKVDGNKVFVRILAQSACASCHAKSACTVADMSDKIIEVSTMDSTEYKPADSVTVTMKKSLGNKAVFFAYFMPFILVLACLIALLGWTGNELVSGLTALGILIPYYIVLYLLRDKMKKAFHFEISK